MKTDNLHRSMAADDKFLAVVGRAQKAVEDLTKLAKDMSDISHAPVSSQVMALDHLSEDFAKLSKDFHSLRSK